MNSIAKRLMAVFAVFMMIAAPAVIVLSDGQDSSATEIDCSTFHYIQLNTDLAKHTYEDAAAATTFDGFNIILTTADKEAIALNSDYVMEQVSAGLIAAGRDNPRNNYYFKGWGYEIKSEAPDIVEVNITNFDPSTFTGSKTTFDTEISTLIDSVSIDVSSEYDYVKIKNIHDYVADVLSYDKENVDVTTEPTSGKIRSLYASLNSEYTGYKVVCEGYAKLFKALCDRYGIGCLIISGDADTGSTVGPHMWNYVLLNGQWYLVDCTWDDQEDSGYGIITDYLLVGSDKVVSGKSIANTYTPKGSTITTKEDTYTIEFVLPPLSAVSINLDTGDVDGVQHKVTFNNENDTLYEEVYVREGEAVTPPKNPTDPSTPGWQFLKWTKEDGSDYDMSSPVLADLTLKAKGTIEPIWTLSYETDGGTKIADQNVLQSEKNVKITEATPVKEGYNFKGWNSSPTGNGLSFAPGEEITMESDFKLYAVWEDTSTIAYKIDSVVDKAAVFLSKETVPGVNNLLLSIGVVTALISLLAILAISRK